MSERDYGFGYSERLRGLAEQLHDAADILERTADVIVPGTADALGRLLEDAWLRYIERRSAYPAEAAEVGEKAAVQAAVEPLVRSLLASRTEVMWAVYSVVGERRRHVLEAILPDAQSAWTHPIRRLGGYVDEDVERVVEPVRLPKVTR
jgi:hypothetical protein